MSKRKSKPKHQCLFYDPRTGETSVISECHPIGKHNGKHFCKYCHTVHSDWWMMNQEDYQATGPDGEDLTIVLCGKCEHTSALEFIEDDDPFRQHKS